MKKVVFLFGAGAELCFGLPSGAVYTYESILRKKDSMHNALKEFYDDSELENIGEYTGSYVKQFHLKKKSAIYHDMLYRTIEQYHSSDKHKQEECEKFEDTQLYLSWKEYKDNNKVSTSEEKAIMKEKRKDFKSEAAKVFKQFISEQGMPKEYVCLKEYLEPVGVIERDFTSIMHPKVIGNDKFWRLVNYFWSAYFTIMLPLLQCEGIKRKEQKIESLGDNFKEKWSSSSEKKSDKCNIYTRILNSIEEISNIIESSDFIRTRSTGVESIYGTIKETFDTSNVKVITLNYTPLCKEIELGDDSNYAFLAGALSLFELPHKLHITNSLKDEHTDDKKAFFFPYLCTQAPIKPIVGKRLI